MLVVVMMRILMMRIAIMISMSRVRGRGMVDNTAVMVRTMDTMAVSRGTRMVIMMMRDIVVVVGMDAGATTVRSSGRITPSLE